MADAGSGRAVRRHAGRTSARNSDSAMKRDPHARCGERRADEGMWTEHTMPGAVIMGPGRWRPRHAGDMGRSQARRGTGVPQAGHDAVR